ncbi:hypothetical protein O3M35_007584 [Rhynocoris fuscipes]|uniref:Retrotransposon gag domain-containing protein n=1 Tax=Rhynocoris fuscipes TaxID=488301 RepID=A0AAW1DHA2_9HEMI
MEGNYFEFSSFILKYLDGDAKAWFEIKIREIKDLDTFIKLFKEKFNLSEYETQVTWELRNSRCEDQFNVSPNAYVSNLVTLAYECQHLISEKDLCKYIWHHFGERLFKCFRDRGIITIDGIMDVLSDYGEEEIINIILSESHKSDNSQLGKNISSNLKNSSFQEHVEQPYRKFSSYSNQNVYENQHFIRPHMNPYKNKHNFTPPNHQIINHQYENRPQNRSQNDNDRNFQNRGNDNKKFRLKDLDGVKVGALG